MSKILTREVFREAVFARDNYQCVICGQFANCVHHIMERRLFQESEENGGYFLDNGVSVCEEHHIKAETTEITPQELRNKAGISKIVLPSHLYDDMEYDKWGNIVLPNGQRYKGELFNDESVQKIIKDYLPLFQKYIKYPRTWHLPGSILSKDDRQMKNDSHFHGKEVVGSLKMDGENCLGPKTELQTRDGIKTIKEICESKYTGDVLSQDIVAKKIEYQKILDHNISITKDTDQWFEIELENGIIIEITGEHYVYLPFFGCYRKVKDLEENDEVDFYL